MLICDFCSSPLEQATCRTCGKIVGYWCPWCDIHAPVVDDKTGCRCTSSLWQCWCDLCGQMSFVGGCPHIVGHIVGVTCPETAVFLPIGDSFQVTDTMHFCPTCDRETRPGECPHWEMVINDEQLPA